MPTVQEYSNALFRNYSIEVISSDDLLNGVRWKQHLRVQEFIRQRKTPIPMKVQLTKIPMFDPALRIQIKPILLLHAIGRITTPPVPNLADISSTWAIIRYIWAFDTGDGYRSPRLILSDTAREIDFHQKTLLSDEVGMGMACYIMTNFFGTDEVVNISEAINNQSWSVFQQYSASPDFIFFNESFKQVYIVECKGNQTSYDTMLNQIRRGTEQVPSVIFQDGRQSVSIVIGTCMLRNSTKIYILDPPNGDNDSQFEYEDNFLGDNRIFQAKWSVDDDDRFTIDSRLLGRAKMFNFAGLESEAIAQLPLDVQDYWRQFAKTQIKTEILKTKLGGYIGVREVFTTIEGLRLELFRGILEDLRERCFIPPNDQTTRIKRGREAIIPTENYFEQFKEASFILEVEESNEYSSVQSVCRDGTILQFTIRE